MKDDHYFKDITYSLEKALYYERGRGAYFRGTMIGVDFIERKGIDGKNADQIIDQCITAIVEEGIFEGATYEKDETGRLFTFEMKGCVHLPVEAKLQEEGVPTYICPPTNMILYKLGQLANLAVEIAKISVEQGDGRCVVKVVAFEKSESWKAS